MTLSVEKEHDKKSVVAEMFIWEREGAGLDGARPMAGGGHGRLDAAASCTGSEPQRLPHVALTVSFPHVLNHL